MKRTEITVLLIALSGILMAQKAGKLTYRQTITDGVANMSEIINTTPDNKKQTWVTTKELLFNEKHSLYQDAKNQPVREMSLKNKERVSGKLFDCELNYYVNFIENKALKQVEYSTGNKFLVENQVEKHTWKFTGKQENILGYLCLEAVIEDCTQTTVWFAPDLALPLGPGSFTGFPGAVLKASLFNGTIVFEAVALETGTIENGIIECPNEGKKISSEENNNLALKMLCEKIPTIKISGTVDFIYTTKK